MPHWMNALAQLKGAYAENTIRAYRGDFADFGGWCDEQGVTALPTEAETLVAYVEARAATHTPATISRRLAGIGRVHRLLGYDNPTRVDAVALALKRIVRGKGRRQRQAAGLSATLRDRLLSACGSDLRGLRDQALIAVGYDTLCRRSELVQLRMEDIDVLPDGDASMLVRRSKTDQAGEGRLAYLGNATVGLVEAWARAAGFDDGPLFRPVLGLRVAEKPLHANAVPRILKALAKEAQVEPALCKKISGHSMRVGAAVDMAENGIDLVPIMHAGGWKSPNMVVRYTQQISLQKSGMAQLHAKRLKS